MSTSPEIPSSRPFAVRAFGKLTTLLLPSEFAKAYCAPITAVFADAWRSTHRRPFGLPLLILWLREFFALARTGITERTPWIQGKPGHSPRHRTNHHRQPRKINDMIGSILQDIRYALKGFAKNPVFTLVVASTLALGIGANTAIFSVVSGVLLQPLPYDEPGNLVAIHSRFLPESGYDFPEYPVGSPEYFDYVDENRSMESVAAISTEMVTITSGNGDPETVPAGIVSSSMFTVLRTPPLLGRTLLPEDDGPEPIPVYVLEYDFWQRRFGGDSGVIGQTLQVAGAEEGYGTAGEIVGVMPAGFAFPSENVKLWTTLPLDPARTWRGSHWFYIVARLAEGVSYEQAEADMSTIMADWEIRYPDHHTGHFLFLKPLLDDYVAHVRPALLMLLGAVGFVLLIACANVANVLLARGEGRRREIAVRSALGAARGRLVQQLLTENLLLAVIGGVIGVVLARVGVPMLLALEGGGIPRVDQVALDGRVLGFTALLVLLTALVFGLAPTFQGAKANIADEFRERTATASAGKPRLRFRALLIVAEMALAILLVVGAGLMAKSFWNLLNEEPGFRTDHLLTAYLSLPSTSYAPDQATEFYGRLTDAVSALPGVDNAALVSRTPLAMDYSQGRFHIEGWPQAESGPLCCTTSLVWAGPGIFRTLGTRLLSGRFFDETDVAGAPRVVVVDEILARTYWPGDEAVGKRVRTGREGEWATVVGVVDHVQFDGLGTTNPTLYEPYLQLGSHFVRAMVLAVRTSVQPSAVVGPLRDAVRSLDPNVPIVSLGTVDAVLEREVARPKFLMTLLSLFAGVALVLGVVGVYGVMSHAVAARTNEIGVRIALGARAAEVARMVTRQGFVIAMAGVAVGLGCAVAATRLMSGLLFNVSPTDPWTFGTVAVSMAVVALLASYLPARRASKVDPIEALRVE